MTRTCFAAVALVLICNGSAYSCGKGYAAPYEQLARDAVSEQEDVAKQAIAKLREAGPAGLAAMMEMYGEALAPQNVQIISAAQTSNDSGLSRAKNAIDAVAGQRYGYVSGLYWHTDLSRAQLAAHQSGLPILSLRLLGKLTDEYSCANSRFFRTTLYANRKVADYLRSHFILHWESERPVPRVTIDFGDGRTMQTTVTGNSIHYILTADAQPVDALPGLYSPAAFLDGLQRAESGYRSLAGKQGQQFDVALRDYHEQRRATLESLIEADLERLAIHHVDVANLDLESNPVVWQQLAALHDDSVQLDDRSRGLIGEENPPAERAGSLAITKSFVETPLLRMLRGLRQTIAQDTIRNEYVMHRTIHEWFAAGEVRAWPSFNDRVYAELFLTPASDAWLGLAPATTYTALVNGGRTATSQ